MLPQLFFQNILPEKIRIEQLNVISIFDNETESVPSTETVKKGKAEVNPQADPEVIDEKSIVEEINEDSLTVISSQDLDTTLTSAPQVVPEIISETPEAGNYYITFGSYEYISDAIRM